MFDSCLLLIIVITLIILIAFCLIFAFSGTRNKTCGGGKDIYGSRNHLRQRVKEIHEETKKKFLEALSDDDKKDINEYKQPSEYRNDDDRFRQSDRRSGILNKYIDEATKNRIINEANEALNNIDVSYVEDFTGIFFECTFFLNIDIHTWNMSRAKCTAKMFQWCTSVKSIRMPESDLSRVYDTHKMFNDCYDLKKIINNDKWRFNELESAYCMFYDCRQLTELSSDKWGDLPELIEALCMFHGCESLTELILPWSAEYLEDTNGLCQRCSKLKYVDISTWKINKESPLGDISDMFRDCRRLETLKGKELLDELIEVCDSRGLYKNSPYINL